MHDPLGLLEKNDRAFELIGFALGIGLIFALRALLPEADAKKTRVPMWFLGLAAFFGAAASFLDERAKMERPLAFLYAFFLLASSARSAVILVLDIFLERRTHKPTPGIFRDVIQAVVYIVVAMATLRTLGVEPGSILTTSAVLTAVVGLALQDTLGNMVSGLALQMQRPFDVGDWVQYFGDGQPTIGKVTEVNWRATSMMTHDMVEVIVPNGLLAKSTIRNFSRPSRVARRNVAITAPYDVSPERVHGVVLAAIRGVGGVLEEPAPSVVTKNFGDNAIEYGVYYFIDDMQKMATIEGRVRDRIYYAFQRESIDFPFPTRTLHMHEVSEETKTRARDSELEKRDRALRCVSLFDVLSPEAHRTLAGATRVRLYAAGEIVVREGERSSELYVIDRGSVSVEIKEARRDSQVHVATLTAGQFFGEMSLITGEERKATVRADVECSLLVVDHDAFQATLAANPEIVERLSDLLATRQAEIEEKAATSADRKSEPIIDRSQRLISQIRGFFKL